MKIGAVDYIARLAKGGMRDSITTLEKCLDYSTNLTLDVVLKVTSGGITEQGMLQLLRLILNKNSKDALLNFNEIYMSGMDISLFQKLFIEFIENCIKYIITDASDIVSISDITINWINERDKITVLELLRDYLFDLLRIRTTYPSEDLKIILESWIIQKCS